MADNGQRGHHLVVAGASASRVEALRALVVLHLPTVSSASSSPASSTA